MKLDIVDADDWVGLYVDGKLAYEDHSLDGSDLLDALEIEYSLYSADQEWLENRGNLPKLFKDVKVNS